MLLDKKRLLDLLVEQIEATIADMQSAFKTEHEAAMEAPGANETRYDTTKEDKTRIASAIGKQIGELRGALSALRSVSLQGLFEIRVGALVHARVQTDDTEEEVLILFVPGGMGKEFKVDQHTVKAISPGTPVADALWAKKAGEVVNVRTPGGVRVYNILSIS